MSESGVAVYSWHFMPWPYLDESFDKKYESGWITVPNCLFDRQKAIGLYQEYIDELAYADELGFDGVVLNEHHQNIYGLMPAPNLLAAALSQRTKNGKIVVLEQPGDHVRGRQAQLLLFPVDARQALRCQTLRAAVR
jgi:hypothetical protein